MGFRPAIIYQPPKVHLPAPQLSCPSLRQHTAASKELLPPTKCNNKGRLTQNTQISKDTVCAHFIMACVNILHETFGGEHKHRECHQNATIPMQHIDTVKAPWPGLLHKACWTLSTSHTQAQTPKNNHTGRHTCTTTTCEFMCCEFACCDTYSQAKTMQFSDRPQPPSKPLQQTTWLRAQGGTNQWGHTRQTQTEPTNR